MGREGVKGKVMGNRGQRKGEGDLNDACIR